MNAGIKVAEAPMRASSTPTKIYLNYAAEVISEI
jgi:hypothetical protein